MDFHLRGFYCTDSYKLIEGFHNIVKCFILAGLGTFLCTPTFPITVSIVYSIFLNVFESSPVSICHKGFFICLLEGIKSKLCTFLWTRDLHVIYTVIISFTPIVKCLSKFI